MHAFRHGKAFGSPFGEPAFAYYAEFEWADMDAFKSAARSRGVRRERQGRDGDGHPVHRHLRRARGVTEPDQPRPLPPEELGFERIVYEKELPRATVTLNRPEVLNAFDFRMLRELARVRGRSWDDEIRVVVVTGTGRAFCVGADLRAWGEDPLGNSKEYWKWFGAFKDMHDRLREIGKPTLARVNGIAVGGGNELQMACDLAVMVDDAFIRHVGLEHGSVPAGGATQWLPIMIGDRRAREMILLCDEVPRAAAVGPRQPAVPAAEPRVDAASTSWLRSPASCPRRPATRSSS